MQLTEKEIRQALIQAEALLPTTEAEILSLDHSPSTEDGALPDSLSADNLLARIRGTRAPAKIIKASFLVSSTASEGLARAARNGSDLPDEISAKMMADRKRIEGNTAE